MLESVAAGDEKLHMFLVDTSRAVYFNAFISNTVAVKLSAKAGYGKEYAGLLDTSSSVTWDAAGGWESTCQQALEDMGVETGRATPCVFGHTVEAG